MLEDTLEKWSNGKRHSKTKLSQAVEQRWTSVCKMLMRLLQKWDAIVMIYGQKDKTFPLSGKKKEVSSSCLQCYLPLPAEQYNPPLPSPDVIEASRAVSPAVSIGKIVQECKTQLFFPSHKKTELESNLRDNVIQILRSIVSARPAPEMSLNVLRATLLFERPG